METLLTTGVKEVDWKIFDYLSDQDIMHLCMVNSHMKKLCDNQEFWEHRLHQRKPKLTWKQKYIKNKHKTRSPREFTILSENIKSDPPTNVKLFALQKGMKEGDIIYIDYLEDKLLYVYIIQEINQNQVLSHVIYQRDEIIGVAPLLPYGIKYMNSVTIDDYVALLSKYFKIDSATKIKNGKEIYETTNGVHFHLKK